MTLPPNVLQARRIAIAVNPVAGYGLALHLAGLAAAEMRRRGHDTEIIAAASMGLLVERAQRAVREGIDILAVVGGDGMANLGTQVCTGTDVPLLIIGVGGGNDTARSLGLPTHRPVEAARLVDTGIVRRADVGREVTSGKVFLSVLATGFDARVNKQANKLPARMGRLRYAAAAVSLLPSLDPVRYRLTLDGEVREVTSSLVAVGNSTSYGGGVRIAPDAVLDDGQFDVVFGPELGRMQVLRLLPAAFLGKHTRNPRVEVMRARRVRIEAESHVTAYADGESLDDLPVEVECVPEALPVLLPRPKGV